MILSNEGQFDIFVGSRIGSFKHLKYHIDTTKNSKKHVENLVDVKSLQKDDTITSMVWGNPEQTDILIGKKNQQIQIYNTEIAEFTKTYTADFGAGDVVGLGRYKRKLLAAVASGVVKIWSKREETTVETGKIDRMRVCGDDTTLFATGGEENDLKVWRIGETTPVFMAKNLPHDWLQLRQPVWVSDLAFLPGEGGNLLAVCSRHGYVRLYDTRAQRRPVCNVNFPGMAATCIEPGLDERQVLVGFGRGQVHQVDLRKGRPDKGYKGCAGAVTSLALHPRRLLVTVSLDRHLRVHSLDTKQLLYKQYLTSKLSSVLVQTETSTPLLKSPEVDVKEELDETETQPVDELDELFDSMETVGEKPRKKHVSNESVASEIAKKMKPSTEGSTDVDLEDSIEDKDDKILKLLKSTEKQKRRMEKRKKEKKARSVFHTA
ncbi:unnamed protein product [Parnassius apollo]|uniref:(apollo) hypothetical protein n=1 Tax=Parnassius apollo TaxID=110799 RepID=A0A8S3XK51_PARAO|nr:unnamed protein product [Parnassius apollo]